MAWKPNQSKPYILGQSLVGSKGDLNSLQGIDSGYRQVGFTEQEI